MQPLILVSAEDTPKVKFDASEDVLEISGRSLPENAIQFYQPVIDWLTLYSKNPKHLTNINFHFEFMSTSSVKQIMKAMMQLDELSKTAKVNVIWSYDKGDSHMKHTGELLEQLVSFKFNYREV